MKTTEELAKDIDLVQQVQGVQQPHELEAIIAPALLDAYKAGMSESAEICVQYKNYGDSHPPIYTRKAILRARDNKTEI